VLVAPIAGQTVPAPEDWPQDATSLPGSAHHRMMIWRFTAQRVAERPVFGWGFDSSRSIPGREESLGKGEPALPLHPHNAALQWWLELGLPGALIGAIFLTVLVAGIARHLPGRAEVAAGQGLLVAATVVANVSYGVWQGWWIGALALSAAFLAAVAKSSR
jgi:O-antigen ligase